MLDTSVVIQALLKSGAIIIATYFTIHTILPYAKKLLSDIVGSSALASAFTSIAGFILVINSTKSIISLLRLNNFLTEWLGILAPAISVFDQVKMSLLDIYANIIVWVLLASGLATAISKILKIDLTVGSKPKSKSPAKPRVKAKK